MNPIPSRRRFLRLALGLGAGLGAPATRAGEALQWRERALLGFGSSLWLRAAHADPHRAEAGLGAAVAALRHVESQMSLFDPASALSRLNRDGVLDDPHPDLLAVLRLARAVAARSDGAFDVSVQPLWLAWDRARRAGRLAGEPELRQARSLVDWRGIDLSPRRVQLRRPGMALTLNGIAQGCAADLAKAALQSHGIAHALLDTGEWSALGTGPDAKPWTLGVADPRSAGAVIARLHAHGRAVATSSDAHYSFSADRRHHHILDPRTGDSPRELASVTVAAPSCALADALTKVVFMGGWRGALPLARRWNVDVLVVDKAGRWQTSARSWLASASPGAAATPDV